MTRLIGQARRGGADPDVFAGLVLSCRYCGLLDASIAADEQARRLDPKVTTSVGFSLLLAGLYERGIAAARTIAPDIVFKCECLLKLGRGAEAVEELELGVRLKGHMSWWCSGYLSIVRDDQKSAVGHFARLFDELPGDDPEAHYMLAKAFAQLGETERGLAALEKSVIRGYYPYSAMSRDPWLDSIRSSAIFARTLEQANDHFGSESGATGAVRRSGTNKSSTAKSVDPVPRMPSVCQVSKIVASLCGIQVANGAGWPVVGSTFGWSPSISTIGMTSHAAL